MERTEAGLVFMKSFFVSIFVALLLSYAGFVLVATEACVRIERSTVPVKLGAMAVSYFAKPWATPETMARIEFYGLKSRLNMANFMQKQFYTGENVVCGWNKFDY